MNRFAIAAVFTMFFFGLNSAAMSNKYPDLAISRLLQMAANAAFATK